MEMDRLDYFDDKVALLVEDNPDLLWLYESLLKGTGVRGIFVHNSEEAEELEWDQFDLAALDYMLAGSSKDGVELAISIRETNPDIRIVIFSAAPHGAEHRMKELGVEFPLLGKPFGWDELSTAWLGDAHQ